MFITALFTIAKTWKQPKCPLTEVWVKKLLYIYTMEYYSAITRNEIMAFATTWMDLEIIILSKVIQTVKDKHHIYVEMWNLKKKKKRIHMNLLAEQKQTKSKVIVAKGGKSEGRDGLGFGD